MKALTDSSENLPRAVRQDADALWRERGVFFLPWVGARWGDDPVAPKVLILGESHYSTAEAETPDLTRQCVGDHAAGVWNHRFFTMLTQLVTGQDHHTVDRAAFWERVCFYNYVQRSVADHWGVAPTEADFVRDEAALRAVMEVLSPSHVLVCSWRLWNSLPAGLFAPQGACALSDRFEIWSMQTQPCAFSMGIPHPSRAARVPTTQAVAHFLSYPHEGRR